jgi:hypothetical protein
MKLAVVLQIPVGTVDPLLARFHNCLLQVKQEVKYQVKRLKARLLIFRGQLAGPGNIVYPTSPHDYQVH